MKRSYCWSIMVGCVFFAVVSVSLSFTKDAVQETVMGESKFELLEDDSYNQFGQSAEEVSRASGGAWSDTEFGPTIYQKGYWRYTPQLNAPATPPSGATITYLTWQWSVVNYRSDLLVQICNDPVTHCLDVSSLGIGGTNAWDGWPANTNFKIRFGIAGTGTITPYIYGQNDTINVSWEY